MSLAAFQNPDLLRAVAGEPVASLAALANTLNRDPSNTRKTVNALRADGVLTADALALTDLGRRVLAGINLAEGVATAGHYVGVSIEPLPRSSSEEPRSERSAPNKAAPTSWPAAQMRANTRNRKVDPDSIPGMADSIVARGVLQPLILSPVDAEGVRTIWAGERRWRGYQLAVEQGRDLPDSLRAGLPFVEMAADSAEALAITLTENGERRDIPALEEAFLLLELATQLGFNAKQVADYLGRKPRDVQDKIRIAREASPEALAAYDQDGSWDRLRDSVTDRKAATDAPLSLEGRGAGGEGDRSGDPVQWTTHDVHKTPFADRDGDTEPMLTIWIMHDGALDAHGGRFTIDWIANVDRERVKHTGGEILPTATLALTREIEAIRRRLGPSLPRPAREWLDQLQGPFVVDGVDCYNATNAGERRKAIGWDSRPSNSGGGLKGALQTLADEAAAAPGTGLPLGTPEPAGLSPRARLALIEIAHKTAEHPRPTSPADGAEWTGDPVRDFAAFGAGCGKYWLDPAFNELQASRFARAVMMTDQPPVAALTPDGVAWFRGIGIPLPVSESQLANAQLAAIPPGGTLTLPEGRIYACDWLAIEATPSPVATPPAEAAGEQVDLYDRTPEQIAADAALLARARAFADQDQPTPDGADFRSLWAELGLDPEVVISQAGGGVLANPTDGSHPVEILTADSGGALPDERASAIAWLTAWAIEQALGEGAV